MEEEVEHVAKEARVGPEGPAYQPCDLAALTASPLVQKCAQVGKRLPAVVAAAAVRSAQGELLRTRR